MPSLNQHVVNVRSIPAVEVFNRVMITVLHDLRVVSAHSTHIHDYITVRMPANDHPDILERIPMTGTGPIFGNQVCHTIAPVTNTPPGCRQ
jgi:hypothetical protein